MEAEGADWLRVGDLVVVVVIAGAFGWEKGLQAGAEVPDGFVSWDHGRGISGSALEGALGEP